MRVEILTECVVEGERRARGDVIDVPEDVARTLEGFGFARPVTDPEVSPE